VTQQPQAVILQQGGGQHGKAMLVIQQDKPPQQQQPPQQTQYIQQVINGQPVLRQVVVAPSSSNTTTTTPANPSLPVTTPNHQQGVISNHAAGSPEPPVVHIEENKPPTATIIQRASTPQPAVPQPPLTNGQSTPPPTTASPTPPQPAPSPPPVKIDPSRPFLCEWAGCMKAFKTPKEVEGHAIAEHCPVLPAEGGDIPCLWARCDGMKRKRFSLMTHLQDRHCHPQLMKLMAVRRVQIMQSGKSDVPLPPAPPPHPGYAPNAALHAIKRHAQEFITPKEQEMKDEKEGPVTKSIRLTASLILRNLVIYSSLGRSRLRAYESHLSTVALSNVESSRTVSQILYDMANAQEFP